tara:strand:+ start:1029 stop:1148 length:120 start_codon:yes stop_codon:yes gene_type:complete
MVLVAEIMRLVLAFVYIASLVINARRDGELALSLTRKEG